MNNKKKRSTGARSLHFTGRDRMLLSIDRERRELWNQLWRAPLEKLEEPYQKGWERYFVLSKQAERRRDAAELAEALELVRNYQRCAVNPFLIKRSVGKKKVPWEHNLSGIRARRFLSLKVSLSLMHYFRIRLREPLTAQRLRELVNSRWGGKLWFRYPEYAVSLVQPYWITHVRVALPEVESRLHEIEGILNRDGNSFRLERLKDIGVRKWMRYDERGQDLKEEERVRREVQQALAEFENNNKSDDWRPVLFLN